MVVGSTSLAHCEGNGDVLVDTILPGSGIITITKTFVTQSKPHTPHIIIFCHTLGVVSSDCCILVGVGYEDGLIKVFTLSPQLHWTNRLVLTVSLATELHNLDSGKA